LNSLPDYHLPAIADGRPAANDYGSYKGSMSNHDKVYENLVNTLLHSAPYYTTSAEAMKTVEIIERIYAAAGKLATNG
jgi:UDP-N-acetyl-2-amino-2-deoxyglucuronate dehydrogenase